MPSRQVAAARQLLAQLLSARGMFEEAARHLTQAVESQPIAFQQLTAVKRMTEADRPLIDRVRRLVEAPELDVAPRIHINFGLGKAYDDLGEYAEAIRHYDAANRLRANSMRLNRAAGGCVVRRPYQELDRRDVYTGAAKADEARAS